MTRQEYNSLLNRYLRWTGRPSSVEYMTAIMELFYENEDLKGRVYELEATLDGRG